MVADCVYYICPRTNVLGSPAGLQNNVQGKIFLYLEIWSIKYI